MRAARLLFVAAVGGTAMLFVTPLPAAARTTVKVDGDTVTLTVPIDCAGCLGEHGPDGSPLAEYWKKVAESAWNDAFSKFTYCKYKFKLDLQIRARGADFRGEPGDSLVNVSTGNPNGRLVPPPGFEQHTSNAYQQDFDANWDAALPPNGVTHEVGHLLGLPDDYTVVSTQPRVTIPNRGRRGTMMADGGPIDPMNIDGIGQLLEHMGLIDKCPAHTWTGTVTTHVTDSSGAGTCIGDWAARLVLKVRGNSVFGTTTVTSAPVNSCGKSTFARVGASAPVHGSRVGTGFTFDTAQFVSASGTARLREVDRNRVHGEATTTIPYPDGQFAFDLRFDLRCTDCR